MAPQILVDLAVNTQKFITDVTNSLGITKQAVTDWSALINYQIQYAFNGQSVTDFQDELDHLNVILAVNQQQFASLTSDLDDFQAHSMAAAAGGKNFIQTFNDMDNAMTAFGLNEHEAAIKLVADGDAEINSVNKVLIALGQGPLTVDELATATGQLSVKTNELNQAMANLYGYSKPAAEGEQAVAAGANEAGGALDFLANRIKTVVASLLIVQTIYQVVQAIKDMTAASQELAQIQFELSANIEYANKALGGTIGTLADWQAEIDQLSKSLQTFSKQDITEAVSKAIELTGQLGLTKDQMSGLITVAGDLAQRTGKSLIDTLTELANAVGGGRLQGLHDLGLYIRAADLQNEAYAEGITTTVNNLTDQERATIALNVVMKASADLIQTTGDYADTTAGQMAAADARAKDSTNSMSSNLAELNLALKNIWADFLGYVSDAFNKFTALNDLIAKFNLDHQIKQKAGALPDVNSFNVPLKPDATGLGLGFAAGGDLTGYLQGELASGNFNQFLKDAPHILDTNTEAYAKLTQAVKDYADALQNAKDVTSQEGNAFGLRGLQIPNSVSQQAPTDNLSDAQYKAMDDTTTKIEKLFDEEKKKLDAAQLSFIDDSEKLYNDRIAARLAATEKLADAIAKANQQLAYNQIDETTKYHRDLQDLETTEAQKEADAADARDKKIIDDKKKYYDALKLLDDQFYFDIFDAVANNDAIAILAAERKYNLDKEKLQQNYKDQNDAANQNYTDTIATIQKDTERQRQLLKERYDQKNQDLLIQHQRELDADNLAYKDELDAANANYDKQMAALQSKWDSQKTLIAQQTTDAYNQLVSDLQKQLDAQDTHWKTLLKGWSDYYNALFQLQQGYQGILGVPPMPGTPPPTPPPPGQCPAGLVWCALFNACLPPEVNCGVGVASTGGTSSTGGITTKGVHKVIISSDGSVSDAIIGSVVKQLSDTIQTIVVERGG